MNRQRPGQGGQSQEEAEYAFHFAPPVPKGHRALLHGGEEKEELVNYFPLYIKCKQKSTARCAWGVVHFWGKKYLAQPQADKKQPSLDKNNPCQQIWGTD